MSERTGYAQVCAERRERHRSRGCPGGQHYVRRDPDGPDDRPWKCRLCPYEQAWSGGYAAWLANHAPVLAGRVSRDPQVPGQLTVDGLHPIPGGTP